MDLKRLGQLIREKRETLGMPAAVLARRANIGRTTLWILEKGENPKTGKPSRPSRGKVKRLASALHMGHRGEHEMLRLAGYETNNGIAPDASASHRPSLSALVPAAAPLPTQKETLSERIERLIESENLTEEEIDMLSEGLKGVAHELVALLRSARQIEKE